MPRARDPARDKAYEIYAASGGKIDLVEIARKLNAKPGTVRGWKNKDKWEQQLKGTFQKNTERSERCKQKIKGPAPLPPEVKKLLENEELNEREKLFCFYFDKAPIGNKAVLKAGYDCQPHNAARMAWALLQKPKIKEELRKLKEAKFGRAMLTVDDIFEWMLAVATSDIKDFVTIKAGHTIMLPEDQIDGTLIKEIKTTEHGVAIKLHDPQRAWEWLADHMDIMSTAQRRQYELAREKLEMDRQRLEIEKQKNAEPAADDYEDDGFLEALKGASGVWGDDPEGVKDLGH